jgi:nucleotide-binding universal stress UspA family protein
MSSVIQKVIDLIYLPLLIIRSYGFEDGTSDQIHYENILLPIDSSRRAECALSAGILLAQGETLTKHANKVKAASPAADFPSHGIPLANGIDLEPRVFLTSVICPPQIPIPAPYPVEIHLLSDQLLQVSRDAVLAYLAETKHRLPVESELRVVESSNISSAIQELAEQENIDLIVMSAHGYSGQFDRPYGNVTRNTIERGTKSTLVIQDIPRSQVQLTDAAVAAGKSGRR